MPLPTSTRRAVALAPAADPKPVVTFAGHAESVYAAEMPGGQSRLIGCRPERRGRGSESPVVRLPR